MKNTRGTSLMEVAVATIILTAITAMALPQYARAKERVRMSEYVHVLKTLHSALKAYQYEHGDSPPGGGGEFDALGVEMTMDPSKYSYIHLDTEGTNQGTGCTGGSMFYYEVRIQSEPAGYSLAINKDGKIACVSCGPRLEMCRQLGFQNGGWAEG